MTELQDKTLKEFQDQSTQNENLSDASTKAGVRVGLLEEVFDQGRSTFCGGELF